MRLVAGPFESELTARFQQLYLAPRSIRPAAVDPASLPPAEHGLGAMAAPTVDEWAHYWADQHFHDGTGAHVYAVHGYLAAMWADGSHQDDCESEEWGQGWIAGCAARLLGYRGLSLAVQQQSREPYPAVPPRWMVINLFTGDAVPTPNRVTARDAALLTRGYGVLENESALPC